VTTRTKLPSARLSWRASLVALALLALVRVLDPDGCWLGAARLDGVSTASVFAFIVQGITLIGSWLGTAAAATAGYLAAAVSWLASHLALFIKSTGAVFARAWDAMKIVYADVLKPAIQWVDDHLRRLYNWLHDTLRPVFNFLNRVKNELLSLYARWLRPFLDVIDIVRGGLRVLGDLGVQWARTLDARLGQLESVITENFLRVLGAVNRVIDTLNSVITVDRLLQRFTFLRTLQRDVLYVGRAMNNARMRPLTETDRLKRLRAGTPTSPIETARQIKAYVNGETNDVGDAIDAAVARALAYRLEIQNQSGAAARGASSR